VPFSTPSSANRHSTKEEHVARYVREAIVAGRLRPGERIRQQALATELGMSPTPVREALRGLVTEGWLELKPHAGVSVAEVDESSVDEVYQLREMLEGRLAAEAARHITPAELRNIRSVNQAYKKASAGGDHAKARELNFQFHSAIWDAGRWPIGAGILNALWAQRWAVQAWVVDQREKRTFQEHNKVVAALAKGDPEAAREALAAHVRSGRSDYHRAKARRIDAG
jgi:DNA-binding GntR family transcriptional regulator